MHSKGFPYEPVENKEAPIECYKSLAGAIVARATEDYCIVQIFYRDDSVGRFDKIYQKAAEHQYKKWKHLLETHADKKRKYRAKLHRNEKRLDEINEKIRTLRSDVRDYTRRIDEIERKAKKVRGWKPLTDSDKALRSEILSELLQEKDELEKKIASAKREVNDLMKESNPIRKEAAKAKYNLKQYKKTENYDHKTFHKKYHHRNSIQKAMLEEAELRRWFASPQFELISPLSGDAIIYQSHKAVYERGIDRANKFIFVLPTENERGEGNNTYDERKRKK